MSTHTLELTENEVRGLMGAVTVQLQELSKFCAHKGFDNLSELEVNMLLNARSTKSKLDKIYKSL